MKPEAEIFRHLATFYDTPKGAFMQPLLNDEQLKEAVVLFAEGKTGERLSRTS